MKESDAPFEGLLCANCERPSSRRAGNCLDEIASFHTRPNARGGQHTHYSDSWVGRRSLQKRKPRAWRGFMTLAIAVTGDRRRDASINSSA